MVSMVLMSSLMAQKPKTVQLTPEGLPDELLEYMNGTTSDKDRQKENTKVLKEFKSVYTSFDSQLQQRLVSVYSYTVKAKMKGNPEMCGLTKMLTTIATTPSGGENVGNAYSNAPNLDGFVVLPDGQVTVCEGLYWHKEFIIGDISKMSIMDIWNSDNARMLTKMPQELIPEDSACRTCKEYDECRKYRGICWKYVLEAYGDEHPFYPDPRCPYAPSFTKNIC